MAAIGGTAIGLVNKIKKIDYTNGFFAERKDSCMLRRY